MRRLLPNLRGALARTFPDALTHAQAVAFNSFLALFPVLLVILGVLTATPQLQSFVAEMLARVQAVLPPGTRRTVIEHLQSFGGSPVKWILLGLGGALFCGSGAMACLMQGFRVVHKDEPAPGFWWEQRRALLLLCITVIPWVVSVAITVFGRQLREWMIRQFGLPEFFHLVWTGVYTTLALILALITLGLIYHFGRHKTYDWKFVWPGALVATVLWWLVNTLFGYYVRAVPYSAIYGGLAAAIGLLVWMYMSAVVVYIGAAYNAEMFGFRPARRREDRVQLAESQPAGPPSEAELLAAKTRAPQPQQD
jgi:membrane protein